MIPVDQAQARIAAALHVLPSETLPLQEALGHVLAETPRATLDLPRFDQSAVDGYAARSAELAGAPLWLPVNDTIAAAARSGAPVLAPGGVARIFTGGWLPHGADTIVRQELTERDGNRVRVLQALPPDTDLRRLGEELRLGDAVGAIGQRITPGLLGAMAMAGVSQVRVHRRPRIRVLVTGDEVAPPGVALKPGQVPDANGPLLRAHLADWGHADVQLEYVPDRYDTVCERLAAAFDSADLVLTTGGVSVGDHDHIPKATQAVGGDVLLWKVAQKPGMPLFVARRGGALLFGLPGNPASVLVNLLVYVKPALAQLQGAAPAVWLHGIAGAPIRAEAEKTFWLRMTLTQGEDGIARLKPLGKQGSHMLSNLAQAQVLVRVPPSPTPWPSGTVLRYRSL